MGSFVVQNNIFFENETEQPDQKVSTDISEHIKTILIIELLLFFVHLFELQK